MCAHIRGRAKRRVLLFVVAGAMALGLLAGCTRPSDPPKPSFKGELTLWAADGLAGLPLAKPAGNWFEERANAFAAAHTDIKVTVRLFPSPLALEEAIVSGKEGRPDLAFGRFVPEAVVHMADINAALDKNGLLDYHPAALTAFQKDGGRHGLPVLQEVQVLALNEAAFGAAGVKLPEGGKWTADEFENSLSRLSNPTRFGLGFYQLPGYHEWWPLAAGLAVTEGATPEALEAAAAGMARLARWRTEGLIHPDSGKVGAEAIWKQFAASQPSIAVLPVSSWAVPTLRKEPYNAKFAVAGFPGMTTGYTYGFSFFKQADALKLTAAVDLAQFVAAPDQQVRLARETGLVPARISSGNPFKDDIHMTRVYELTGTQRPLPAGPAWDRAELLFHREILLATLGDREPKAALAEMQKLMKSATAPASK